MRKLILFTLLLGGLSWCQTATTQPAPPPIVLRVEMPPTNLWVRVVELVIPGLIGAGSAFLGVWLTNWRNAAENAANRAHQFELETAKDRIAAEAKSRDNRWNFRKDVYSDLIHKTVEIMGIYTNFQDLSQKILVGEEAKKMANDLDAALFDQGKAFWKLASLAPLARAEHVLPLAQQSQVKMFTKVDRSRDIEPQINSRITAMTEFLSKLQDLGRKDLWGTLE